jgi:hypothetical protein
MTYKTGKPGQVIYYARNSWEERREVVLVRYYKDNSYLLHNNCAIVDERGFRWNVDIKDLYRKAE